MKKLRTISFILIPLIFIFLIKLYFVHPSFSDENVYYAMGKIVGQGQRPYLDFNFVHPPFQLYLLAGIFTAIGSSLTAAKLLPLISSSMTVVLMFLISKKIFDEKSALISALLFIITPAFLAFSDQGYGMWESIFFLFASLYLALKEKYPLAGFLFSLAFFTRYLSAFFFPLMLLVMFYNKLKWKKFLVYAAISSLIFFLLFYSLYGYNFIDQTIFFQIFAKRNLAILSKLPFQYLQFGFFSFFIAVISLIIGIIKKDRLVVTFSLYPLLIDSLIFFGFTTIIYHYFLISLSFLFLGLGRSFTLSKDKIIQLGIIGIIFVSLYHNFPTIDYYQTPSFAKQFYDIADFVANRTTSGDKIFGESSVTTYIMFSKNIPISSSYLDSFLSYLIYKDEKSVIVNLEREKPKFIIDMNGYYEGNAFFSSYLSEKYARITEFSGIPTYIIYQRKV